MFLIAAGMLILGGIPYLIFGDSNLETWNSPEGKIESIEFIQEKKVYIETDEGKYVLTTTNAYLEPIQEDQRSLGNKN